MAKPIHVPQGQFLRLCRNSYIGEDAFVPFVTHTLRGRQAFRVLSYEFAGGERDDLIAAGNQNCKPAAGNHSCQSGAAVLY